MQAGPLDATLASRLMTRLGATDVTVPNVQLDIPTPENEAERNEQVGHMGAVAWSRVLCACFVLSLCTWLCGA